MKFYAHTSKDTDEDSWHLLVDHLNSTGNLASEFSAHFGSGVELLARQAGVLHDLGKYSSEFQDRLRGGTRVTHSTHGAKEAIERYGDLGYFIAYAIAGHHAGLANGSGYGGRRALDERLKDTDLPQLSPVWKDEIRLADKNVLAQSCSKIKLAHERKTFQLAFLIRMLFSCLVDADRLDTEKFFEQSEGKISQRGSPYRLLDLQKKLNAHLQNFTNNPTTELNIWRNKILAVARSRAADERGMFSLTVPTGGGKTLTSLAFALDHAIKHNLRRIIYVIPYTNIIEQTAQVFRQALGEYKEAVLEHHSGFVVDDKALQKDHYQGQEKLKLAMENWDSPIVVTTAVQFFESLFSSRTSTCRKLHNIASSVIVLDEVQTTPLHVLRPCVVAMQELALNYRSSIVLCTATQPALHAPKFKDGFEQVRELIPEREAMFKFFERVKIRKGIAEWSDADISRQIKKREQVLCIVNNRIHARMLVDSLSDCKGIRLLTTMMCAKHRRKVLAEIRTDLEAQRPCRLIATSLVEAGVDIDFPAVLRAEAGLDSIAQAAGRCNREGKRKREDSEVIVFKPEDKWKAPLELRQFAQVARGIMRRNSDVLNLASIENYFTELYWQKGDAELDSKGIMRTLQESGLPELPFEKIDRDFEMIENLQRPIIIAYDEQADELLRKLEHVEYCGGLARALQPYLVQVPNYAFNKLSDAGVLAIVAQEKFAEQFIHLQRDDLYHKDYGLDCDNPDLIAAENLVT